ncbi:MAG: hypothetical protein ABJF23_25390 [Bryobacteraceae bacterium]
MSSRTLHFKAPVENIGPGPLPAIASSIGSSTAKSLPGVPPKPFERHFAQQLLVERRLQLSRYSGKSALEA